MEKKSAVFLGEPGSFTEGALDSFLFGHPVLDYQNVDKEGCSSWKVLFQSVADGKYDFGCVPLENSVSGPIDEALQQLGNVTVHIVGETNFHHELCLCSRPGVKPGEIKAVYSHPRMLQACKNYLTGFDQKTQSRLIRGLMPTTTQAAQFVAKADEPVAVICSKRAAQIHSLEVVESNIGDDANASSRFIVISAAPMNLRGYGLCQLRCLISFTLQNVPGALFKFLSVFAFRNVNICNLYNRPLVEHGKKQWSYKTYLTFNPHTEEEAEELLKECARWCVQVKQIGLYPEHLDNTKVKAQTWDLDDIFSLAR